jgi:hypothetical protein
MKLSSSLTRHSGFRGDLWTRPENQHPFGEAFPDAIRLAVHEEIRAILKQGGFNFDNRPLDVEEASEMMRKEGLALRSYATPSLYPPECSKGP